MKHLNFLKKTAAALLCFCAFASALVAETFSVGLSGNAYVTKADGVEITKEDGVKNWRNHSAVVSVFFFFAEPQKKAELALRARGKATFEVSCGKEKFKVKVSSSEFVDVPVGTLKFGAGYQRVDIRVLSKKDRDGKGFGEISDLVLSGVSGEMNFVRDFDPYWGRRGPSVHLTYELPKGKDVEYFYNEVCVPEGADPVGTYYMACGFAEGYFGFQVNSTEERRVLFSVWSPFDTQDPKEIPEEDRVILQKKGEGVKSGEFGNEGAGGQSYLRYPWKAGTTYRMLVGAKPLADGGTRYSGWFYAPEEGKWRLVASFVRPRTQTWVRGTCSFLENFSPESGWKERRVLYKNQWAMDTEGKWHELTTGRFMGDGTASAKVRLDFEGALTEDGSAYELRNCGFFVGKTDMKAKVKRKGTGTPPDVDVEALEKML